MVWNKRVFIFVVSLLLITALISGCGKRTQIEGANSTQVAVDNVEKVDNNQELEPAEDEGDVSTAVEEVNNVNNSPTEKVQPVIQEKQEVKKSDTNAVSKTKVVSRSTAVSKSTSTKATPAKSTSAKPASGGAVALDWWSEAQYVFPRESTAKVTDVGTGKTFYVKRTFGTNHADCEALTAKDSDIIKGIWGGWSWVRRPVIVEAGGRRIAASMTAMPHAGLDAYPAVQNVSNRSGGYGTGQNLDAVKGNGMDGHIDIHFLNSETHGTNKVDSQHQNAIKQAIGK